MKIKFMFLLARVAGISLFFFVVLGVSNAAEQDNRHKEDITWLGDSPIILYFGESVVYKMNSFHERNLLQLHDAGVSILITGNSVGKSNIREFYSAINRQPIFDNFKIVYRLHQSLISYYQRYCKSMEKSCPVPSWLNETIGILKEYENTAGYYVFDEPAQDHGKEGGVGRVSPNFQKLIYDAIRKIDPDKHKRPVINTNAAYQVGVDFSEISPYLSADFQDLILLQRYSTDVEKFTEDIFLWQSLDILSKVPHLPVYPAFIKQSNKSSSCNKLESIAHFKKYGKWSILPFERAYVNSVNNFQGVIKAQGAAYYVYRVREDYNWWKYLDMSACTEILNGVLEHARTSIKSKK